MAVKTLPSAQQLSLSKGAEAQAQVGRAVQQWRYLLYHDGLLQPVILLHTLHGFEVGYAIKPTATRDKSGCYYYPPQLDVIALYQHLLKCELSLKMLIAAKVIALDLTATTGGNSDFSSIEQLDQLMTHLALGQDPNPGIESASLTQIQEMVSFALNELVLTESSGELASFGEKGLTLLSYLALYRAGKSYERLVGLTATDPALLIAAGSSVKERTNFTLIIWRLNERLREGLQTFVNTHFGRKSGIRLTDDYNFIVEDRLTSIIRVDEARVWVDGWQLDQLATRYRCSISQRTGLANLEQAYQLMQNSTNQHNYGSEATDATDNTCWNGIAVLDDYANTCINLLGVFGERLNRKLELLELPTIEAKCEYYLNLWYSINLKLAGHYQKSHSNLNRVIQHLAQCQLTRPDEPEPILTLLKLTHQYGDLSKFNRVYRHYKKCCQEIEMQPDETVQTFYSQVTTKASSTTNSNYYIPATPTTNTTTFLAAS